MENKKQKLTLKIVKKIIGGLNDCKTLQGKSGNWDYDPYMHGMYNGFEFALSLLESREPEFRSAPKKWLKDIKIKGKAIADESESFYSIGEELSKKNKEAMYKTSKKKKLTPPKNIILNKVIDNDFRLVGDIIITELPNKSKKVSKSNKKTISKKSLDRMKKVNDKVLQKRQLKELDREEIRMRNKFKEDYWND